jgi:CRP-like cAMP-binding protein
LTNALVKKLSLRDALTADEQALLERSVARVKEFPADQDIVKDGQHVSESCLLLDGMAARYKLLEGGRRQITALHITGDFVDLHSFLLKRLDHGVVALSACTVALVPHEALKEITETSPHLTRMLWLSTLMDASIHREWITGMGQRPALERAAHLFCEVFTRLRVVGKTEGTSFRFPLTQAELGDALGLSLVHVNRVAQALRSQGLLTWEGRTLTILDLERLKAVAGFDDAYLYLYPEPR